MTTRPHHQILQATALNILQRFANALVSLCFLHYFLFTLSTAFVCEAKTSDKAPDLLKTKKKRHITKAFFIPAFEQS